MIRKNIPNFITCLNVVSGCLAVLFAIKGQLTVSVIFIFAGAIFDFFDGMAARLLKVYSAMGKELDSLADMITFGLAPGVLMMAMMEDALFGVNVRPESFMDLSLRDVIFTFAFLLIPVFSALRLAKFNIDTRQTDSFIGLPTPANALLISALALIAEHGRYDALDAFLLQPVVLLIVTIAMSLLLVSEIPMFSLKLKNLSWKDNKVRFLFLILSATLILAFNIYGIAAAIVSFILISILLQLKRD